MDRFKHDNYSLIANIERFIEARPHLIDQTESVTDQEATSLMLSLYPNAVLVRLAANVYLPLEKKQVRFLVLSMVDEDLRVHAKMFTCLELKCIVEWNEEFDPDELFQHNIPEINRVLHDVVAWEMALQASPSKEARQLSDRRVAAGVVADDSHGIAGLDLHRP